MKRSAFERGFPHWAMVIALLLLGLGFGVNSFLAELLGGTLLFTLIVVYSGSESGGEG